MTVITPIEARDALITMMYQELKRFLDKEDDFYVMKNQDQLNAMKRREVNSLVESAFEKIGADFRHPTKESMMQVIEELKKNGTRFIPKEKSEQAAKKAAAIISKIE